jgi:hypothetical protein
MGIRPTPSATTALEGCGLGGGAEDGHGLGGGGDRGGVLGGGGLGGGEAVMVGWWWGGDGGDGLGVQVRVEAGFTQHGKPG